MFISMGVAIDDAFYAPAFGVGPEPPIQIEPIRAGVEFNPRPGRCAGIDDRALIDFVGVALQEESSRQMAKHVHIGIMRGGDEPLGRFALGLTEALMNA